MGIGSKHTFEFLKRFITSRNMRLLEVGCGRGELAALLSQYLHVRAIDSSQEAVLAALQLGVDAHVADFLNYDFEPFDIVFFSRSLHHIHPLEKAIERADALMKVNGLFVIEDFAAELADRPL
jgi:SAM-dependent methyltransferase